MEKLKTKKNVHASTSLFYTIQINVNLCALIKFIQMYDCDQVVCVCAQVNLGYRTILIYSNNVDTE